MDNNNFDINKKNHGNSEKSSEILFSTDDNNNKKYPKNKRKIICIRKKDNMVTLNESEDDCLNKYKKSIKYKYPKISKLIKTKKERHCHDGWSLYYPNILLDKYVLTFSLMIHPIKKFMIYRGIKDTFVFIQYKKNISFQPNASQKSIFSFGEYNPEVKAVRSWRCHFKNIIKNKTDDYFTSIDIKNGINKRKM